MPEYHKRLTKVGSLSRHISKHAWRVALIALAVGLLSGCEKSLEQENQALKLNLSKLTEDSNILEHENTNLLQEAAELRSKVAIFESLLKSAESRQEEDRKSYNSELAKLADKHQTELGALKENIRTLETELVKRDAALEGLKEKADANAGATARNQKADFGTALVIVKQMKDSADNTVRKIAFTKLQAGNVYGEIADIVDNWQRDFDSNQIKVWDYTKVTVDNKNVQDLSESIRTFYTNIRTAFNEKFFNEPGRCTEATSAEHMAELQEKVKNLQ